MVPLRKYALREFNYDDPLRTTLGYAKAGFDVRVAKGLPFMWYDYHSMFSS